MLIRVEDISFAYGADVTALQKVSFTLAAGESLALVGHNGSGKSTLVKQLNGLLKPSAGKVWVDGLDTATNKTSHLAGRVAVLFQNPDDQLCMSTVWDEVVFGPRNLGYDSERIEMLASEALALFQLTPFATSNPHDLGYSERKRVCMASIVAMDTPVLVFDEPTAGLDSAEVSLFCTVLRKLNNDNKATIIISHDMDFVAENTNRAIVLAHGTKVFDGSVPELFANTKVMADNGLCQPQVVQLADACGVQGSVVLLPEDCAERIARQLLT